MSGKAILKEIGSTLLYIVVVLGITWLVITFVGQRTEVNGSSMEPTLSNNDNLIVDKISYRFREPERFEIVVFPYQYEENTYYIKRIIGLPGETVEIIEGSVYINGEKLKEDYTATEINDVGIVSEKITLGGDEYFVLGDDRDKSEDSRMADVGNVKRSYIYGKAWFLLSPFDHMGFIKK